MKNDNPFWFSDVEIFRKYRKLDSDKKVDVCIIGGGITGITIAYYLSKSGLKIALLEKEFLCSRTTARSTGKITIGHGLFYNYLINSKGKDYAKKYFKANELAINNIEKIITDEKIECNFERKSNFVYTNKIGKIQQIKDEVDAIKSLGFDANFVNEIELLGKIEGAVELKNQAQFNPLKYSEKLAEIALNNGVEIYENSKAIDYEKNDNGFIIKAETDEGKRKVSAKYVIIATRYPIFNVPNLYFMKMYQELEYGIAIKTNIELNGMYISDDIPRISLRSVKNNNENYIIIVGNGHKTGEVVNDSGFDYLEEFAKNNFNGYEIVNRWVAEDAISLDKIPYIGCYSSVRENMFVATGFNKWGMTNSNIAANIISDKILGINNKYEEVFQATRFEPIKNREEIKNMLKEAGKSIVLPRANGKYVKKYCPHLGCELKWNSVTETWDCPCHGSRFEKDGKLIDSPSTKNL